MNAPASQVVLIDTEMSENMLRHWVRDQNIDNTAAVVDCACCAARSARSTCSTTAAAPNGSLGYADWRATT